MADERDRTIDRLLVQNDALVGKINELLSAHTRFISQVKVNPQVRLNFSYNEGEGHFRFEANLEDLKDPDVRDALAKGRAILETVHAERRRKLGEA